MSADNLRIWSQLATTDPAQTKEFQRPGGFRGTAIKPMYAVKKMTEVFGPCGQGWGADEPKFEIVGDAVFCTIGLWWSAHEGASRRVYGVGGDLIVKRPRAGEPYHDDEAFKKAYTDALTNAMKHLGMSADVHLGEFDGCKYTASARQKPQDARGDAGGHDAPPPALPLSDAPQRANERHLIRTPEDFEAAIGRATKIEHIKMLDNILMDWIEHDHHPEAERKRLGDLLQAKLEVVRNAG